MDTFLEQESRKVDEMGDRHCTFLQFSFEAWQAIECIRSGSSSLFNPAPVQHGLGGFGGMSAVRVVCLHFWWE